MITKEDLEMAERLSKVVESIDREVFPKKPIEVFVLDFSTSYFSSEEESVIEENRRFRYCSETPNFISNYNGELYLIFGNGLVERVEEERKKRLMLFRNPELGTEQLPYFSLEEFFVALACHEVRHRVQYCYFPRRMFSLRDIQEESDLYFQLLLNYVDRQTRYDYPPEESQKIFKKEVDAGIIEHFAVEKWHWGLRDLNKIAKIIKSQTIEELLKLK